MEKKTLSKKETLKVILSNVADGLSHDEALQFGDVEPCPELHEAMDRFFSCCEEGMGVFESFVKTLAPEFLSL